MPTKEASNHWHVNLITKSISGKSTALVSETKFKHCSHYSKIPQSRIIFLQEVSNDSGKIMVCTRRIVFGHNGSPIQERISEQSSSDVSLLFLTFCNSTLLRARLDILNLCTDGSPKCLQYYPGIGEKTTTDYFPIDRLRPPPSLWEQTKGFSPTLPVLSGQVARWCTLPQLSVPQCDLQNK